MVTVVDNSRLGATALCDNKAVLEHVLGYQSREDMAPLRQGRDGHSALAEFFRTGGDVEAAMAVYEREYKAWAEANVGKDDRLNYENTATVLREWFRTHPLDRLPFIIIPETVERGVQVPLVDGFEFFALIDVQARMRDLGTRSVVDHKFTGAISSYWAKTFRLSSQFTGYLWAVQQQTGEVMHTAIVNAIEVGMLPSSDRKCRTHGVPYFECRAQHAKWEFFSTTRCEAATKDWYEQAMILAHRFRQLEKVFGGKPEMIGFAEQQGKFNGGCRGCGFAEFCLAGRRVEMIETLLQHAPWEPWNGAGGE